MQLQIDPPEPPLTALISSLFKAVLIVSRLIFFIVKNLINAYSLDFQLPLYFDNNFEKMH